MMIRRRAHACAILFASQFIALAFIITTPLSKYYKFNWEDDSWIADEPKAMNKTLVIVMGNLRGGEDAWTTLYSHVLLPNDADLALLVMDDLTQYPNSSLLTRAKYVWWYDKYDDWAVAIDLVNGTSWRETHLPLFIDVNKQRANWTRGVDPVVCRPSVLFGGIKGFHGSAMLIFMLRWFVVQHILSERILHKYDRFCVTRTDHYYICPQNYSELDLRERNIWVPSGEDYGGYNDRHLVVGRANVLDALDLVPYLIGNPFHYDYHKHYNSESFLKYVWAQKNLTVRRFQRGMFIASTGLDPGKKKPFNRNPNLFVKYPSEFEEAVRCQ